MHHGEKPMVSVTSALIWVIGTAGLAANGDITADNGSPANQAQASAAVLRSIPPGLEPQRHYYNATTGSAGSAGGLILDDPVYANSPPPDVFLQLPPDTLVADDLHTEAVNGCPVKAYEFLVAGGGDGTGPGFTVSFALYDGCPNGGGVVLPGTDGSLAIADDGLHSVLLDLSASPVAIDNTVWLGVSFDRAGPGWVVGTPAEVGFTSNIYDIPFEPCSASFAGTTLYAGFHTQVYCEPPFDREFLAYYNANLGGMRWVFPPNWWIVDDVELIIDNCVLSSYDIGGVATGGGTVTVTAELRRFCGDAFVIEGTQGTAAFIADDSPAFARFDFPGGVALNTGAMPLWVAYKFDRAASSIFSGQAALGYTDDFFGLQDGSDCNLYWFGGNPWSGFAITVRCLGNSPTGACCDLSTPGAGTPREFCREVQEIACQGSTVRFESGAKCPNTCSITSDECTVDADCPIACSLTDDACVVDADCPVGETCTRTQICTDLGVSFDPTCGTAACCTPPNSPFGETCVDLDETTCESHLDDDGHAAVWQPGQFCGQGQQDCISWICRFAEGSCDLANGTVGCNVPTCCDTVCDMDPFCCIWEWDSTCATRAVAVCTDLPVGNDTCFGPTPDSGAYMLNECSVSLDQCFDDTDCPAGQSCEANGATTLDNRGATTDASEGFCCHRAGAGTQGFGGVWAKFTASEASARVDTCGANNLPAWDALLQVFRATDHTDEQAACNSLVPIGCNDDSDWISCQDGQAAICLYDLNIGETYYVLLGAKAEYAAGEYRLTVTSPATAPCSPPGDVPVNNTCDTATIAATSSNFDLNGATAQCPGEACAVDLTGDVWFEYTAPVAGSVTFDTCSVPQGDTILLVYDGGDCPATGDRLITCNDDALDGSCGVGSSSTIDVEAQRTYLIRVGARDGDAFTGELHVSGLVVDCQPNGIPDDQDIAQGTSEDCQLNDVPDECDIAQGSSDDCQANGVPDECDIAQGSSTDDNGDGVPDECQIEPTPAVMTMEVVEVNGSAAGLPSDDLVANQGDLLKVEFYLQDWAPLLANTHQLRLDGASLTSSGTGAILLAELPCTTDGDCYGESVCDGNLCDCSGSVYVEATDSRPDHLFFGRDAIIVGDCTSNLAQQGSYLVGGTLLTPPWGVPDQGTPKYIGTMFLTVDENADGTFTLGLMQDPDQTFLVDSDDQIIPLDWSATLTLRVGANDCNGNRIPDDQDIAQGTSHDCQANGVPDECDITQGASEDCQANGTPDECDIASGSSGDDDGDGIPDECQTVSVPAVSQWGLIVLALLLSIAAKTRSATCRRAHA